MNKTNGKVAGKVLAIVTATVLSGILPIAPAYAANASHAEVVGGSGSVTQAGTTTTVSQGSQRLAVDWTSLSTTANEALIFRQPNTSAIVLNRITGSSPSSLLGRLTANGQVYILNPNGVLFGAGAQVNVGGLVASTLGMNRANFMNGGNTFMKGPNANGSVVNQGTLTSADGGYIALLGATVRNEGKINARMGTVALGAGSTVTLTFNGNSLVRMQVDESVVNSLAENGGLIQADGGMIMMKAGAANSLLASVVNNTGIVEARTVDTHGGTITLLGGMAAGTVNVAGTLDASAPGGGNGGAIETSAATVAVASSARITTSAPRGAMGSWLIDPNDFIIAASGGNITGAALSAALATTNMIIDTTGASASSGTLVGTSAGSGLGNINVNDAVNWSSSSANAGAHTLTLNAAGSINVNAPVTWGVSGTPGNPATTGALVMTAGNAINVGAAMNAYWRAPLTMNTGIGTVNVVLKPNAGGFAGAVNFYSDAGATAAGGTGLLAINGNGYTVISDVTQGTGVGVAGDGTSATLQGMQNNAGGYYALGSDIDASATASWNSGTGFSPIGNFSGVFDGLGHVINGFTINTANSDVGLFGMNNGTVRNVGMAGGSVTGAGQVGGLAGSNAYLATISNSYNTGTVNGTVASGFNIGGLAGYNGGAIRNSYATGGISGMSSVGGLVGTNVSAISDSYATGAVSGGGLNGSGPIAGGGGLVGYNTGTINNSHATGDVGAQSYAGGLVGVDSFGTISNSYATGNLNGSSRLGGLAGYADHSMISNSYATGNVSGPSGIVGGLVGQSESGSISNSYATGRVTATSTGGPAGGLVGLNAGSIRNSYATGSVSNLAGTGGLVGQNAGSIANSYAVGTVIGTAGMSGGLIGTNGTGMVSNSFYDSDANPSLTGIGGMADVAGAVWGMSTAAMQNSANFTRATGTASPTDHNGNGGVDPGWDLPGAGNGAGTTWFMYDGFTTPLLQAMMTPLTITANNASTAYDGTAYSGGNGVTYSVPPDYAYLLGTLSYGGTSQGAASAGSYAIAPGGLYSSQQGYMINFVSGSLTIDSAPPPIGPPTVVPPAGGGTGAVPPGNTGTAPNTGTASDTRTISNTIARIDTVFTSSRAGNRVCMPSATTSCADGSTTPKAVDSSGTDVTIGLGGNGSSLKIQGGGVNLPASLNQQK